MAASQSCVFLKTRRSCRILRPSLFAVFHLNSQTAIEEHALPPTHIFLNAHRQHIIAIKSGSAAQLAADLRLITGLEIIRQQCGSFLPGQDHALLRTARSISSDRHHVQILGVLMRYTAPIAPLPSSRSTT